MRSRHNFQDRFGRPGRLFEVVQMQATQNDWPDVIEVFIHTRLLPSAPAGSS